MVFKRRDKRPLWRAILEFFWPRGGWGRAARYIRHRLRRLPDSPEKIARGVWAGVFVTFTPFYGLHFLMSAALAWAMRGNVVAALLSTFFGNPLTYVPIAIVSLKTGHFLLGHEPGHGPQPGEDMDANIMDRFNGATADLWHNFKALFTEAQADWHQLSEFWDEVFWPWLVGGIIPGMIVATVMYYLAMQVIRAYQSRRRKVLRAKLEQLKKKPAGEA